MTNHGLFYLALSLGYAEEMTAVALLPVVGLVALGTLAAVVPAARLSDHLGRKPVIFGSCAIGAIGLVSSRPRRRTAWRVPTRGCPALGSGSAPWWSPRSPAPIVTCVTCAGGYPASV